jgi:conjugative transfer signal peptidase TraF
MKAIFRHSAPAVAVFAFALLWAWGAGFRLNLTPSLPIGMYRLCPGAPGKGDVVSFCLEGEFADLARERGYLQAGSCPSGLRPLLKTLAGLPGESVNPDALHIREADSLGRSMPSILEAGIIPPGMGLLLTEHPGGFDSRYFGLAPLEKLQKVEPVFLFNHQQGVSP